MGEKGTEWYQINCGMDQKRRKNNKEIIERAGKRHRDHFRHKHTRNRKRKQNEGTVQYTLQ